jgi:UDP-N-acetylglucosamine 4-epimerase
MLIFYKAYGLNTIGLRYFNVLVENKTLTDVWRSYRPVYKTTRQPIINGDGEFFRDFTYIDNVIS